MKAIVKVKPEAGAGSIEFREVPYPKLKPDSVIIHVKAAGICGSDLHTYLSEWPYELGKGFMPLPMVLGHEFAGEIVEVGENVKGFAKGDRVTANPRFYCGKCYECRNDRRELCTRETFFQGTMAEYVSFPDYSLYKLPNGLSYEEGALIEPFAICNYAVYDLSSLQPGRSVVIVGPGAIGLSTLLNVKLSNPSMIIVTGAKEDVSPRLEIAKKLGADITVNVSEEDPMRAVLKATKYGADILFECAGAVWMQGMNMLRSGGEFVAIGHPTAGREIKISPLDFMAMQGRSITIKMSMLYKSRSWIRVMELLSHNRVDLKPLITHRLPLKDAVEGFELAHRKEAVKVILTV